MNLYPYDRYQDCMADLLEREIDAAPDDSVLQLSRPVYYLKRRVRVHHKKNLTLDGNGCRIVTAFNNHAGFSDSVDALYFENCKGLLLKNFSIDTDVPANTTAVVESISGDASSFILKIDPEYHIHGDEFLLALNTVDEDGSPDYRLQHYALHPDRSIVTLLAGEIILANTYWDLPETAKKYLGNHRFEVTLKPGDASRMFPGERVCIRHTMYGPVSMLFKHCDDTVISDVTLYGAPGMGIIVLPRCHNFTLDGFKVLPRPDADQLMAANCDGVHITGVTGKIVLRNCIFDGLGDDALNLHSTAATVTGINQNTLQVHYCKKRPDGVLSADWCRPGDRIRIYDDERCTQTGAFTVVSYQGDEMEITDLTGELSCGRVLQNTAFAPDLTVENCTIRNTRARGLIIQTDRAEIANNTFFGMSYSGVKAAPAMKYWYEVGPANGLSIHDNVFRKCCCHVVTGPENPVVGVMRTHDNPADRDDYDILHHNIRICDNLFEDIHGRLITVAAADMVLISGNRAVHCSNPQNRPLCSVNSCKNVTLEPIEEI